MANEVVIHVREQGTAQTEQALKGLGAAVAGTALGFGAFQIARETMNALTGSVNAALDSAREYAGIQAQTNAVLASTGGVAGISAQAVQDLANSLEAVTGFSDETVQSAENLLLTFTRIGADIMPQATETVLNMATALGSDASSAAVQLGKALQDPILGMTALRRVGVNFSEAQVETVKAMVEGGRAGEAQALILKELQTEFGGSARAAEAAAGGINSAKNAANDHARDLASALLPAIVRIQKAFLDLQAFVLSNKAVLVGLAAAIGVVAVAATIAAAPMVAAFVAPMLPIIALAAAIGGIAALAVVLVEHFDVVKKFWNDMWEGMPQPIKSVVNAVKDFVGDVLGGIAKAIDWIITQLNRLPGVNLPNVGQMGDFIKGAASSAAGAVGGAAGWVGGKVGGLFAPFSTDIAGGPMGGAVEALEEGLGKAKEHMRTWADAINGIMKGFLDDQVRAYAEKGRAGLDAVKAAQDGMLASAIRIAQGMKESLGGDLVDYIDAALSSVTKMAEDTAKAIEDASKRTFDLTTQLWSKFGGAGTQTGGFQNLGTLAFAAEHGGAGVAMGNATTNPDGSVSYSTGGVTNVYGPQNNVYPNVTNGGMAVPSTADSFSE